LSVFCNLDKNKKTTLRFMITPDIKG